MRRLKRYWQEILAFLDLELFVWLVNRRYWGDPLSDRLRMAADAAIMASGFLLLWFAYRLTRKWRSRLAEQVRASSRRLIRRVTERVLALLERWQQKYGRGAQDILGGRTRMEFDLFGNRGRRKRNRRAGWKQLETERERLAWLYAGMIETKLKRGAHIRPAETPRQIGAHPDNTPEQCELIGLYEMYRYDPRSQPPEGTAQALKDREV